MQSAPNPFPLTAFILAIVGLVVATAGALTGSVASISLCPRATRASAGTPSARLSAGNTRMHLATLSTLAGIYATTRRARVDQS
jgi:hypothetical protein